MDDLIWKSKFDCVSKPMNRDSYIWEDYSFRIVINERSFYVIHSIIGLLFVPEWCIHYQFIEGNN